MDTATASTAPSANPSATLQGLSELLVRNYNVSPERLTLDAPLQDLGIDSLGTVELLWSVEDRFGIRLPHDPPALATLGEVVAYVDALVAQNAQAQAAAPAQAPAEADAPDSPTPTTQTPRP